LDSSKRSEKMFALSQNKSNWLLFQYVKDLLFQTRLDNNGQMRLKEITATSY